MYIDNSKNAITSILAATDIFYWQSLIAIPTITFSYDYK